MNNTYINIACGDAYINDWYNFDFAPHSEYVKQADLTKALPLNKESAELVYSSHFFEHIPRGAAQDFLDECFRVLKSGGILRLVMPDFEELCSAYLFLRSNEEHEKADFLMLEILDQCVRQYPGGELGEFYSLLQKSDDNETIKKFIRDRTGHSIDEAKSVRVNKFGKIITQPFLLLARLRKIYIKLVILLLPSAFRMQNVSLSSVGERHAWLYDFYSVKTLLEGSGFIQVTRMTSETSRMVDFPFFPLDLYDDGSPRKGKESMYIEAIKP